VNGVTEPTNQRGAPAPHFEENKMETTFKEKQDFNRALQIALDTDKRVRVVEWLLTGGSGHFAKGLGEALRYADFNNINKIARTWSGIILEAYDLSIR